MLDFAGVEALVRARTDLRLIAIDGLPLAGKSTLAQRLAKVTGADVLYMDDFVRLEADWRGRVQPGFPFPYVRYDDFMAAVKAVAQAGVARYLAYDWERGAISLPRTVGGARPVIVEGVSALHPDLAPLYDLRLWVDSDPATTRDASVARGVGDWGAEWRDLFMPSVEFYLGTGPETQADLRVAGRGARAA